MVGWKEGEASSSCCCAWAWAASEGGLSSTSSACTTSASSSFFSSSYWQHLCPGLSLQLMTSRRQMRGFLFLLLAAKFVRVFLADPPEEADGDEDGEGFLLCIIISITDDFLFTAGTSALGC